jgi:hypothetical protein
MEGWRRLHAEELCNLCASPNIIRMIKLGRMSWIAHTAHIREMRNVYKILVRKPERKKAPT